MPRIGALALLLFAVAGRAGAAWEYRTAHFRVVSEAGAETARAAADRLEAVRSRFLALGLGLPDGEGEPVVVLIFSFREGLDPYARRDARDPALTRGLSLAGEERRWIVVAWEAPGDPLGALAHEYAHLVRHDDADPLWFREGFAEYLSGLESADGAVRMGPNALHHLQLLHEQAWTGWDEFLAADRMSAAFARRNFYAQGWLAVHWLVTRGIRPAELEPEGFESLVRAQGSEQVELQLRELAGRVWQEATAVTAPRPAAEPSPATQFPGARLAADWELPYWAAELHRELQHRELAQPVLERLERQYPGIPEPSEALGALAMAQGNYELAEQKLRTAIENGSRRPLTHHRYSLVLLRPYERQEDRPDSAAAMDRVQAAVWHASKAREGDPREPRYLLGEAQALGVAGRWAAAARLLSELQAFAGWRERAAVEFAELLRRRQQALRGIERPGLALGPGAVRSLVDGQPALGWAWLNPPLPEAPRPAPPPPPKLIWPPPGTVLLYGYINGVECLAGEKIVKVKTPRFTIELRETAAAPARLYHPPLQWDELPCGLSGYEVNVAYRPLAAGSEVRGELVAVVF